ncbi:hypothetical protein CsSME_00054202 [Camellia sinensis var. sinensis]
MKSITQVTMKREQDMGVCRTLKKGALPKMRMMISHLQRRIPTSLESGILNLKMLIQLQL